MGSKCATHLEHDSATSVAGSKWFKTCVSPQFASLNRHRSVQERDRFGGFCTSKRVPNVMHIWSQKLFQMCSTFGVRADLLPIAYARF